MKAANVLRHYEEQGYLHQQSIYEVFKQTATQCASQVAIVDGCNRLTYQQLFEEVKTYAQFLNDLKLKQGDKVLMQLPNRIEFVTFLFAMNQLGIQPVLLLPTHRAQEVRNIGQQVQPKAYIGTSDHLGFDYCAMVDDIIDDLPSLDYIIGDDDREITGCLYKNFKSVKPAQSHEALYEFSVGMHAREVALYLLSGGTTSMPKIIPKVGEAYVYNALSAAKRCQITKDSVYMAVLSIAHDFPLANPGVLATLLTGGKVVLCETTSFDEAFSWIEKERVTVTSIVPAIANLWVENLEWYEADFSSLQQIIIGAAKVDIPLMERLEKRLDITIQQGYGLGEGITCFTSLDDTKDVRLGTQGKPISEADEIKIVDEAGSELKPNEVGEIIEKGPYTFLGYYNNDALNNRVFTADGYFRTGDKGYLDDNGNIVIMGRVVEQINRLGENVIPSEIEEILKGHGNVRDVAVFGLKDEALGEKICACVIYNSESLSRTDIIAYFQHLGIARYKVPDEIVEVDTFPYSNIGKVDKKRLATMIREGAIYDI